MKRRQSSVHKSTKMTPKHSKKTKKTLDLNEQILSEVDSTASFTPKHETFVYESNLENNENQGSPRLQAQAQYNIQQMADVNLNESIMNQIQMQIYQDHLKNEQRHQSHEQPIHEQIVAKKNKEKNSKFKNTTNQLKKNITSKSIEDKSSFEQTQQISTEPKESRKALNLKQRNASELPNTDSEESLHVPMKLALNIPQVIQPYIQNPLSRQSLNSQPVKKLKTEKPNLNFAPIDFTVDIKLLNQKLQVKKILKIVNEDKIDSPNEALYLVEIQDCKEPKIVNNAEMTFFYKDALIHYYQKIHFD